MSIISSLRVSFTVSFSSVVPILGSDIAISCNVTPWANGASLQWMLNDIPFVPQTGITSNKGSAKSVIREKAAESLTGKWTCVVGYKSKEGRASAALTVKGESLELKM